MKNKEKIAGCIVVALQVVLIIYWVLSQGNLYWDTYYTLERTHYTSASTEPAHYINDDEVFDRNKWIDVKYIVNTMVVDRETSVLNDPPQYILNKFIKEPYWVLLNVCEAIFIPGQFSVWAAIGLNILFFIVTQFFLYKLVYGLTNNNKTSLLALILYGFSGMAITMNSYVRFYSFSAMLMMIFVYIHFQMWNMKKRKWYITLLFEAVALVLAYWSIGITQLTLFYYVLFILIYNVTLLIKRRYMEFFEYVIPVGLGGFIYLLKFTNYLYLLTHVSEAKNSGTTGTPTEWILTSIENLSPKAFVSSLVHTFACVGRYAYGYYGFLALFLIIMVTLIFKNKKVCFIKSSYEWILLLSLIGFLVVAVCLNLYILPRYSSYVYPQLAWITAVVLVEFMENYSGKLLPKALSGVIVLAIIVSTVTGVRVDFVYKEDKLPLQRVKESGIKDIVVTQKDTFNLAEMMYEVAVNVDSDAKMMAVTDAYSAKDVLPDSFIMVNRSYDDFDKSEQYLDLGYKIEWVEETYCFYYYYMTK